MLNKRRKQKFEKGNKQAGIDTKIQRYTYGDRQSHVIHVIINYSGSNRRTVCDAEASGTPSGLSPVWETRTDLLEHTDKASKREKNNKT